MNVNVQITLGPDESAADLSGSANDLAAGILDAIGGDENDICIVSISDTGSAGAMPTMARLPNPDDKPDKPGKDK